MLRVAFLGALSSSFAERVRAHLTVPCDIVHLDEHAPGRLKDVDVLVTLVFTGAMAADAGRLRLIQVPGAGLDRIDRPAIAPGVSLANVHGHETGIAEYITGAMIALSRSFGRVDASLRADAGTASGRRASRRRLRGPSSRAGRSASWATEVSAGRWRAAPVPSTCASARSAVTWDNRRTRTSNCSAPWTGWTRCCGAPTIWRSRCRSRRRPRGLLDETRLTSMKSTTVLVNVSRAQIIDENGLYEALAGRRIAGAALDVWYIATRRDPDPRSRPGAPSTSCRTSS
jgi:lactate dehydrogenase-like 2-hydroxyacid dehydrogenase